MSVTLDDVLQSNCYTVNIEKNEKHEKYEKNEKHEKSKKNTKNKKKTSRSILTSPDNISISTGNQSTNEDKPILPAIPNINIKDKLMDNQVEKIKDIPVDKLKDKPNNKSKDKKIDYIKDDIDNILDNDLMNFDNKHQMSMYYIACKSLKYFNKQLLSEYNITIPETLYNSVIIEIIPNLIKEYTSNVKKRCKKNVDINLICIGRKLDGKQCSRKKSINSEYCKSHLKKIINMNTQKKNENNNKTVIRNKRGRKPKVQFDPRRYDNDYLTLWEDLIEGEKVLVDNDGNVYTFNTLHPILLGKKDVNTTLNFKELIAKYSTTTS